MWGTRRNAPASMSRVGAGLAAAALTLAMAPAATAQQASVAQPTAQTQGPAQRLGEVPRRVALRIVMRDCKACKIKLMTVLDRQGDSWESPWRGVREGEIHFKLSARHARGATMLIKAKWADLYGYQPMVAFHYKGFANGTDVSNREAANQTRGTACWVGEPGRESLTVRTGRFTGLTPPGDEATGIRAWVSHTQPKVGRYLLAYKGSVGAQDVVPCGNR